MLMGLDMVKLNDDNVKLEADYKFNDYITSFKLSNVVEMKFLSSLSLQVQSKF